MEILFWVLAGAYATLGVASMVLALVYGQGLGAALLVGLAWPFVLVRNYARREP